MKSAGARSSNMSCNDLTHWDRVDNLTIIDSGKGLSSCWRQAIIYTNAGILLIGPSGKKT